MYDFSFLAPCPASGLILHGSGDTVVPPIEVEQRVGAYLDKRLAADPP